MTDNTNNYWPNFMPDNSNGSNQDVSTWKDKLPMSFDNDMAEFDTSDKLFLMDQYNNMDMNDALLTHHLSEHDSPDANPMSKQDSSMSDSNQPDQKSRRKEQNRAAQRAFRERKERYVKELQIKLNEKDRKYQTEIRQLKDENTQLKTLIKSMEAEIYVLKGAAMAFDVSIHKMREVGMDMNTTQPINNKSPPMNRHPTLLNEDSPSSWGNRPSPPISSSHTTQDDMIIANTTTTNNNNNNHHHQMKNNSSSQMIFDPLYETLNHDTVHLSEDGFAEPDNGRFEHKIDPIVHSGIKMIPYSQLWERLSEHPNFDESLMDELCIELKKKARCSGTGPVIPETELEEVFKTLDSNRV
ncbi:hypothetical protein BDB01DRAFT_838951 [Pilobolus umbonatus]|nr:hypothetical protein BDB01DRAFT_838951 [Pilobolus umbonatus]